MQTEIIRVDNLTVCYRRHPALHHVNLHIECGSLMAVLGPNGAGKSTLLRAIMGWLPLTTGSVMIGDDHAHHQSPRLAYLPQRREIDLDFPVTVRMVVEQGRFPHRGFWSGYTAEDVRMIDSAMGQMRLTNVADRPLRELSGGQQQRVFLARALAQGADILLLDEPFEGLDRPSTQGLVRTFREWNAAGKTVICVLHNLDMAREVFPRAALLKTHLVAEGNTADVLAPANLAEAYGGALTLPVTGAAAS